MANRSAIYSCEACGAGIFKGDQAILSYYEQQICESCAPTWQKFLSAAPDEYHDEDGVPLSQAARQYDFNSHIKDGGKPTDKWGVELVEGRTSLATPPAPEKET